MPVFDFIHEESGEIISVLVSIKAPDKDRHEQTVEEEDEHGVKTKKIYKRVYSAPLAAADTKRGDATVEDYKRVTNGNKKLTVGEMWKISKEMSEQRAEKGGGHDPVKEQFYKDYQKQMKQKHPDQIKQEAKEKRRKEMEKWGIRVE